MLIAASRPQQGEVVEFKPQLGIEDALEDAGRLYDVKQEIYQLADRLLYGLAMHHGLLPESGWDAVDQLASRGILGQGSAGQEASHHLQYTVSFATMLRLKNVFTSWRARRKCSDATQIQPAGRCERCARGVFTTVISPTSMVAACLNTTTSLFLYSAR